MWLNEGKKKEKNIYIFRDYHKTKKKASRVERINLLNATEGEEY